MYSKQQTGQNGSIAIFVIVSAILAAGVIGGIYALQKRGEQARTVSPQNSTSTDTAQKQKDDQKKAEDAKKQAATQKAAADKKAEADKQAAAQKQAQADANKKQAADQKAAQDKAAQDAQKQVTAQQSATASQPAAMADKLPTTGPEDMMPQVLMGATMLAVIGAYLQSYRHRYGSILR